MASPDDELQAAIFERLRADPDIVALVGGRVFDRVTADAQLPYVQFSKCSSARDRMSCVRSWTLYPDIDVWSDGVGFGEAKRIMAAVAECLDGAALVLETMRLVMIIEYKSDVFRDADGLTSHGVVTFKAIVEKRA